MDQELRQILADGYLDGLAELSVEELREARARCRAVETKLSYLRRLIQGHHDVVTGEVRRRAEGGAPGDVIGLVEQLPTILADRVRAPGPGRLTSTMEPGEVSGGLSDRLAAITHRVPLDGLASVSGDELQQVVDDLSALEVEVSGTRRAMFDRIDVIEAELTRRYRDGEASVDDLLTRRGSTP